MHCPNCGQSLEKRDVDSQPVLHCPNCGGSFFEENGINRISIKRATTLSQDKKTDEISGALKNCPKDNSVLAPVTDSSAVPKAVTLLRCSRCYGIFVFPDDLVQFKKAQTAKVSYYKLWSLPFSPLRTILVFSFALFVFTTLYYTYTNAPKRFNQQTQASGLVRNLSANVSGRYLFLTFQTTTPARSQIIFFDKTTNEQIVQLVSDKPRTTHIFSTTKLNLNDELTYQIILYATNNQVVKTEERMLMIK